MNNRLERIARGLLRPINPYAVSILGLLTFTWGLWVINPLWTVFTQAPIYAKAEQFAPEWAWGLWATLCGACLLWAVSTGRFRIVTYALAFAAWHWCTVAGMLWWGDWQNTAGLTYTYVGIYSIYCYLNIKQNYDRPGFPPTF